MSGSGADILLVEDNRDDEELALRALKHHNISDDVVVVRDGVQALDYLFARGDYGERDSHRAPKIVLLDLKLPRVDGHEVLKAMRADERTRHVPVVILTSSCEQKDIIDSYQHGANSYIRKPVNYSQFVDAVDQIGNYWLGLNEVPLH